MIEDLAIITGLLVTAYLVQHFQQIWSNNEYQAATFLKVNDGKATAVFSLAFLGSIAVFSGTIFTGLEMNNMNSIAFNAALIFYMIFFLLLDSLSRGGEHFWERG